MVNVKILKYGKSKIRLKRKRQNNGKADTFFVNYNLMSYL